MDTVDTGRRSWQSVRPEGFAFGFGWLRRHGDGETIVPEGFDSLDICAEDKSGGLADKNKDESSCKEKCLQNVG